MAEVLNDSQQLVGFIKMEKYKLIDIPGIGPAKAKTLNSAGILIIKDLINWSSRALIQKWKKLHQSNR